MSQPRNSDPSSRIPPPQQAGPARRVLHALMTLAGWMVFVYWWWIVFHRVGRREVLFTAVFVAIALAVIVLVIFAWAWHNLRIFRHRGARTHVRESSSDFLHDGVGRSVSFPASPLDRRSAPVIVVRLTDDGKTYEPASALPQVATAPSTAPPAPTVVPGPRGGAA